MSLRDYFAAQALSGFLSQEIMAKAAASAQYNRGVRIVEWYAEASYGMADAMLAEREKTR